MAVAENDQELSTGWMTTFGDLVFLLLTFFVLQFATTIPKIAVPAAPSVELEPIVKVEEDGSETTVIYGAFSPSESIDLSYRGRTAVQAISAQALQLGRDVRVTILPLSLGEEPDRIRLLNQQRMSVVRHLIGYGLPQVAVVLTPLDLEISEENIVANPAKSLTSRLELTIQPKRS